MIDRIIVDQTYGFLNRNRNISRFIKKMRKMMEDGEASKYETLRFQQYL